MLTAVIFDFDGVIVDTEPLHYRAFQLILEPLGLGYSWDEYVSHFMGFDDRDAFVEAFKAGNKALSTESLNELIARKAHLFQNVIEDGVVPYPGVVQLIQDLSRKLPLALCSGALLSDIVPILTQFSLDKTFSVIVTADDVAASKPDPASYALAVRKLQALFPGKGIKPHSCLAIEDTPAGITSAHNAGIPVLAVTNSYPADQLQGAVKTLSSLDNISLEELSRLIFP